MKHRHLNCWEVTGCGREPGGIRVNEFGECRAATEARCDAINHGVNAGRACWLVAGTLCGGEVQGGFAQKLATCMECDFYKQVQAEEGSTIKPDAETLLLIYDPTRIVRAYEELRKIHAVLRETQAQLVEAKKLEAIGGLAAGIAHEINTPAQFISDNLVFVKEAVGSLLKVAQSVTCILDATKATTDALRELKPLIEETDLQYLVDNIPEALDQSLSGIRRVAEIVRVMKEFSHPGTRDREFVDLNRVIRNTLTLTRSKWEQVAEMVTDLDPSLPTVSCFANELHQAIFNIVINAAHAIAARPKQEGPDGKGTIRVCSRKIDGQVEIRISDTGTGIAKEIESLIFAPFFTTREVGEGSGQGLFQAYSAIVKRHGGTLTFESQPDSGTCFVITIPLEAPKESTH